MKTLRKGLFAACAFSALCMPSTAQVSQNNTRISDPADVERPNPNAAIPNDREKELLARIERLEKRLTELEQRSEVSAAAVSPEKSIVATETAATAVSPSPSTGGISETTSNGLTADSASAGKSKNQDGPKFLEEGIIPHSFRIPGTDLSLKLGGYIKADFIQDFDGIGNRFQFATNTIPIRGTPNADLGGGTNIQARETRVTIEIVGGEEKRKFRAYVEGDFYGDSNAFRLRQAYGEYGNLLAGQAWTTFMDLSTRPRTLDYEGSDGEVFVRQAMFRWTQPLSTNWKFAIAAEEPTVQIATPAGFTGSARGNLPDFIGSVRYQKKRGHFQLAGIARRLRFDGTGSTNDDAATGWGFNTTFGVNPFDRDQIMGQFAFGSGISRYLGSMSGQNVDALFGAGNKLVAVPARTAVIAYERHWTPKLYSVFAYSIADISYNSGFAGTVIKRTQDGHFNLIWTPFNLVDLGVEYMWGRRDNQNGSRGDASRLQFSTIYRFN